jgi:hypothetical protein
MKIDSAEIEKALRDPTSLRELTEKISAGEKELATAQKAALDPVTKTNQFLSEINDSLRDMSQNVISKFFNSFLGQFTVNAAALAGISSYAMQTFVSINEIGKDLKKLAYGEAASDYSDATGGILSSLDGYITKNTGFNPGLEGMLGDLTNQITGFFNKAPALAADNTTNTGPEKTTDPIQDAIKNIVQPSEATKSPEAALKENIKTNSKNTTLRLTFYITRVVSFNCNAFLKNTDIEQLIYYFQLIYNFVTEMSAIKPTK